MFCAFGRGSTGRCHSHVHLNRTVKTEEISWSIDILCLDAFVCIDLKHDLSVKAQEGLLWVLQCMVACFELDVSEMTE